MADKNPIFPDTKLDVQNPITVKAIAAGHFLIARNPGDLFPIPKGMKFGSWFVPASPEAEVELARQKAEAAKAKGPSVLEAQERAEFEAWKAERAAKKAKEAAESTKAPSEPEQQPEKPKKTKAAAK